jgi:hypothetical protein
MDEYTMPFLRDQPSTITSAMGNGYNGVADIWHQSPLITWDNPALTCMHEGIALGFAHNGWLTGSFNDDIDLNVSMLTLGYHGLGIGLPFLNASGKLGTTLDYGKQAQTDENGNQIGTFKAYENAQSYNASFNPVEFLRSYNKPYPTVFNKLDFALGLSFNAIHSELGPGNGGNDGKTDTYTQDAGLIMHYKDALAQKLVCEATFGYKLYNLGNQYVAYVGDNHNNPVGINQVVGLGFSASIPLTEAFKNEPIAPFVGENLFACRLLTSTNMPTHSSPEIAIGSEIGFLDTIFGRVGYFNDRDGNIKGITYGAGLSLHYEDVFGVEINFANFPGGLLDSRQHSFDFMAKVDLLKLIAKP